MFKRFAGPGDGGLAIVGIMADDERRMSIQPTPPIWADPSHVYPRSHHGTPTHEFTGFNFGTQHIPMEPNPMRNTSQQRTMAPQLQPLIMPQWPSMLSSQPHNTVQPLFPQPVQPIQPMSMGFLQTPVSATSTKSVTTPRKTLTDADRKRMCQYADENPNSKQTEIGAIFGVERSTVSKVLRQKEKYMLQDEGRRSPVKRSKGRSPDIERALAIWAKNHEKKGFPLNDDLIREKIRAWSTTSSSTDSQYQLTSSWIEKFKLKNNLMGARSRKGSLAPDDAEAIPSAVPSSQTPADTSPDSPDNLGLPSPEELRSAPSTESLKTQSPETYFDFNSRHGPFHSVSMSSLNSAFTDAAPSTFSPGPLSPTSPFFTPDSGTAPSPFVPPLATRPIMATLSSTYAPRPRSQTFPLLDQYMSESVPPDLPTPKYFTEAVLDSPMAELANPLGNIDELVQANKPSEQLSTVSPSETMRPPPLPLHVLESKREITPAVSITSTQSASSTGDVQRALEVVMSFIQQQPRDFLDFNESAHIIRLMEKLKMQARNEELV